MNRLLQTAAILSLAGLTATAQTEQVPLEEMRAEAEEAIAKRKKDIEERVARAINKFAMGSAIIGAGELEHTRSGLVALGEAAVPTIMRRIAGLERKDVLEQLALVLSEMLDEGAIEGESVVDDLTPHLDSEVTPRAAAAISVLGRSGVKSLAPRIRELASPDDEESEVDPAVLEAAVEALGRLGDTESFAIFAEALRHGAPDVRRAAVEAYGRIGRMQDVELVVDMLKDRSDAVAFAATRALERMSESTKAMRALHEQLDHEDTRRVRLTISVLERIGKPELSRRYLREVVSEKKDSDFETAKQAAIALYSMGDTSGRDELSRRYKRTIAKNSKVPRYRVDLAELYLEFGDYRSAVVEFSRAINLERNELTQNRYREQAARCYARLGRFRKAAELLRRVHANNWSALADDPDFEKMREDRRYAEYFLRPEDR